MKPQMSMQTQTEQQKPTKAKAATQEEHANAKEPEQTAAHQNQIEIEVVVLALAGVRGVVEVEVCNRGRALVGAHANVGACVVVAYAREGACEGACVVACAGADVRMAWPSDALEHTAAKGVGVADVDAVDTVDEENNACAVSVSADEDAASGRVQSAAMAKRETASSYEPTSRADSRCCTQKTAADWTTRQSKQPQRQQQKLNTNKQLRPQTPHHNYIQNASHTRSAVASAEIERRARPRCTPATARAWLESAQRSCDEHRARNLQSKIHLDETNVDKQCKMIHP